jgi:hypothetical protein
MERWFERAKYLSALISAVAALAAGLFLIAEPFTDRPREVPTATPTPTPQPPASNDARLNDTIRQVQQLQRTVEALGKTPTRSRLGAEVRSTRQTIRRLSSDMSALKDALGNDPIKALQVTLLQRDLRNASATSKATVDSLRQDIERQYDLMKFVVGTLALGMLGIVVSVVIPALRERSESISGTSTT